MGGHPSFSASSSLRFPGTFYGSSGRCQGFAPPRKKRAPLTPPRASNKVLPTRKRREGVANRNHEWAAQLPPKLKPMTPPALAYCGQKMVLTMGSTLLFATNVLMELKAVTAKYENATQLAEYKEALETRGERNILMWLV